MATEVGPQTKPASRYETFVEQQIARARGRIRALDAAVIALALLVATLTYCLIITFLDQALDLPAGVRLAAFVVFAAGAVVFLGVAGFRLLSRRVNPYYAARQIEQTLPDAKNSVVNWLDLRSASLPPAIRGALGQRAARDLKQADLDQAISTRRTTWLGSAALGLFVVLVIWLVAGGGQAFSLLQRAFAPFREVAIASRTELTLLQPEGGDVTVPLGRPVTFRVHVTGRVPRVNEPDALRLHYRYNPADPYIEQGLEQDADGDWTTILAADQVQGGLWYLIRGGDAQTPEHQVRVRAQAQVMGFDVRYHCRPYLNRSDLVIHYPNEDAVAPHLSAVRGTEVTLTAHANRPVREGLLDMDVGGVKKELPAEMQTGQPDTMRFHFPLDKSGTYRVLFTGIDRDSNTDRSPYRIEVLADRAPLVALTRPAKDVELPANGTLALEGKAEDDFGITKMTLRLQVKDGPVLKAKGYREGKSFRLANGGYPDKLDYKDFVALEKVRTDSGAPYTLAPGMDVKYWLEATDNCDYPDKNGNVGRSKEYLVKIVEPAPTATQQQDRNQAQQAQKQHEKNQDQKLDNQNKQASSAAQNKGQGADNQKGSGQGKSQEQKDFENKADQLAKAVQDKEKQDGNKSQSKGTESKSDAGTEKSGQPGGDANPGQANEKKQPDSGEAAKNKQDSKGQQSSGSQGNGKEQPQSSKNENQPQGNGAPKETQPSKSQDQKQGAGQQSPTGKGSEQKQAEGGGTGNDKTQPQAQDGGKQQGTQATAKGTKNDPSHGNSQKGTDAKSNPQQSSSDAKSQPSAGQQNDASQDKGAGQPKSAKEQPTPGQPKGSQAGKSAEGAKTGATKTGAGQQKSQGPEPGAGQQKNPSADQNPSRADNGNKEPDKSQTGGAAKGDRQSSGSSAKKDASPRDATQDDVARLKEALKDAKGQQQASDALSRVSVEARDPQVRKAAEDALRGAEAKAKESAQNATREDVAKLTEALKNDGQKQGAANALEKIASEARDPQARKAAQDALKKAGADTSAARQQQQADAKGKNGPQGAHGSAKAGGDKQPDPSKAAARGPGDSTGKKEGGEKTKADSGSGNATAKGETGNRGNPGAGSRKGEAQNSQTNEQAQPVNEDFSRRGGVLQLEDLKKKVTPEILKELKWTQEDWQRFLEQARRYEDAQQKQQPLTAKDKLSSGSSLLPSTGPRQVRPGADARNDDLSAGRALPPPEFREAQNIFSGRPDAPNPGKN